MSILSWGKYLSKAGKLVTSTAKVGEKAAAAGLKTAAKVGEQTILHPGKTAVAAFGAYSGWNYLKNDKTAIESGKDVLEKGKDFLVGDKGNDIVSRAEGIGGAVGQAGNAITAATSAIGQAWSGLGNSINSLFTGNAGNLLSNFASNLFNGRMDMLGTVGLLYSATLIFGRHSLLTKLAGTMLAMSIIGSHAGIGMSQPQELTQQNSQPLSDNLQDDYVRSDGRIGMRR